jgi:hypothetical protein
MNLNGIRLKKIQIKLIEPIYVESVSDSAVRRRVKVLNTGEQLSSYLVVEKDQVENKYWLISGFIEYLAYKHFAIIKNQNLSIPVIEQDYSDRTTQRIKLLRKLFQNQSNWLDKHYLLNNLLEEGISIKEIAKQIGVSGADINNYLIHHELPTEIISKAYKNKGSFRNLEQIRRLQLHPILKHKLYLRAVLPIRDFNRLTIDKFQKVLWLLSIKEFRLLKNWQDQWDLSQKSFNYKELLLEKWHEDCVKRLNLKDPIKSSVI